MRTAMAASASKNCSQSCLGEVGGFAAGHGRETEPMVGHLNPYGARIN